MAKNTPPPSGDEIPFEKCLADLEEIVAQLEAGEKPLDESLELYERGVAALKRCHAILDKAEKRIKLLVRGAGGEPELRDAEMPGKPGSSRRNPSPPAPLPQGERGKQHEQGAEDDDVEVESETEIDISGEQHVDSEPPHPQNPQTSVKPKSSARGKNEPGGSLFKNAQ